jgi:hypothetical protein
MDFFVQAKIIPIITYLYSQSSEGLGEIPVYFESFFHDNPRYLKGADFGHVDGE